ncbi:hypothetical protein QUB80_30415 [Chlorogloeopsis sp. ULAP01]|uniref:hypothetical protein n=1 Tax=Chlorogloeopsis sp. ULAP01 TaxID=3056483 RepID=UPI0025AAF0F2|nr:hypothetical protein [Chlorogloeopsis sp. ULAP01]MDM9384974.1 hypothetical protein [Chlorogloeopsis sp. ULAP01]
MEKAPSLDIDNFSLVRGGLIYQLLVRVGLIKPGSFNVIQRSLFFVFITWLPLLLLSSVEGLAVGTALQVPFLKDIVAYSRFLVAVPVLIMAEVWIDISVKSAVKHFIYSGLVDTAELPDFKAAIREVNKLRDWLLIDGCLLVIAYLLTWIVFSEELSSVTSAWSAYGAGVNKQLTLAGWWYALLSLPIYQFLLYRWLWRFLLWFRFLWRISRLHLQLVPTHADLAGGLGFLGITQILFGSIPFVASAVLSANFCRKVITQGVSITTFQIQIIVFLTLSVIITLAPLLVFSSKMLKVKIWGLRQYGSLVSHHNLLFEQKWVRQEQHKEESPLGSPDISSLADLGASFEAIKKMRIVPFSLSAVIGLGSTIFAPLLPLFFITIPLEQIFDLAKKILFGS